MRAIDAHPTDLEWARRFSGERPLLGPSRLDRHLARCASCRAHEAALADERAAFERDPRRAGAMHALTLRAERSARGAATRSWPWLAAAGAGAAALALALQVRLERPGALRVKGPSESFTVLVDRPAGPQPLGSSCSAGDRLMGRFRTSRRYLLLLERDGAGRTQVLLPPGGTSSARVEPGEDVTGTSWVLDATPGRECFAALFSDGPLDAGEAARVLDGRSAPGGAEVRIACCEKKRGAP